MSKILDMKEAKINSFQNIIIPLRDIFKDFTVIPPELNEQTGFPYDRSMVRVYNDSRKIIGFGSLEYVDNNWILDLNIQHDTPERLNLENGEYYLKVSGMTDYSATMVNKNGVFEVENKSADYLTLDRLEICIAKK